MYKNIKTIEISANLIKFETNEHLSGRVVTPKPFDFDVKKYDDRLEYDCNDNYKVVISKNYLVLYQWEDIILKFYMPRPVRFYLIKDIRTKGMFSLDYRKHLRSDYDSTKHVLVNMNGVDDDCEEVNKIRKKAEKYSKGTYHQPIIVIFDDRQENVIRYAIIQDNLIVESSCMKYIEPREIGELPNIFEMED